MLLPGTRIRATPQIVADAPVVKQVLGKSVFYNWGWATGPFINKYAGVSLVLGRRFSEKNVKEVYSRQCALQGSARGVRVKSGVFDAAFFVLYFPPRPEEARKRATWKK